MENSVSNLLDKEAFDLENTNRIHFLGGGVSVFELEMTTHKSSEKMINDESHENKKDYRCPSILFLGNMYKLFVEGESEVSLGEDLLDNFFCQMMMKRR